MKGAGRRAGLGALAAFIAACEPEYVSMGYDAPVENQGTMPNGSVWSCYGPACPYGECDNDELVSDVDCDDAYPGGGGIDDSSVFCQPGVSADYCLIIGEDAFATDYFMVSCGDGMAVAVQCGRGCRATSSGDASCL